MRHAEHRVQPPDRTVAWAQGQLTAKTRSQASKHQLSQRNGRSDSYGRPGETADFGAGRLRSKHTLGPSDAIARTLGAAPHESRRAGSLRAAIRTIRLQPTHAICDRNRDRSEPTLMINRSGRRDTSTRSTPRSAHPRQPTIELVLHLMGWRRIRSLTSNSERVPHRASTGPQIRVELIVSIYSDRAICDGGSPPGNPQNAESTTAQFAAHESRRNRTPEPCCQPDSLADSVFHASADDRSRDRAGVSIPLKNPSTAENTKRDDVKPESLRSLGRGHDGFDV
jgi:hypothetical protein